MNAEFPDMILYEILDEDKVFIGYGGFVHIDWKAMTAEISFLLKPDIVHDDYDEVMEFFFGFLKEKAFNNYNFSFLWTETYDLPHRQQHILNLSKCGFCEELSKRTEKSLFHKCCAMKENVLVTGGAGCIGRDLITSLCQLGCFVVCVDLQCRPKWLPSGVVYLQMDANDLTPGNLDRFQLSHIFHLAATFERSEETPEFWDSNYWHNVQLSHNIGNLAKDIASIKRVVFASSYLIYDKSLYTSKGSPMKPVRLTSDDNIKPRNICGMAKLMHEIELAFLTEITDVTFAAARIFRLYGKGDRCIISRWIRSALNKEALKMYGEESSFDYIYGKDAAEGLIRLARSDFSGIVNLGSGRSHTVKDVADIISKELGVNVVKNEVSEDYIFEASLSSTEKLQKVVGWTPPTTLEKGIRALIAHEKLLPEHGWANPKSINILISSVGSKVDLCRFLSKAIKCIGQGKCVGADIDSNCIAHHFTDEFYQMQSLNEIDLVKLRKDLQKMNVKLVIPTRDGELAFWAKNAEKLGVTAMVSDIEAIETCTDKLKFFQMCAEATLPCIPTHDTLSACPGGSKNLYVVRERYGAGSKGLAIGVGAEEAQEKATKMESPVYSPFVEGVEVTVDFYVSQKGEVIEVVPRTRDVIVSGESHVSTTFENDDIVSLVIRFASMLKLRGHINIQLFMNDEGLHIIECNPRIGGASTLSMRAGCTSLHWFIEEESVGAKIKPQIGSFQKDLRRVASVQGTFSDENKHEMPPVYTFTS
jgi:carbamoyl-phosphate synthase large subunit